MVWIRFLIPGGYLYPLKPRGNHIQTMARSRQQPFQVQAEASAETDRPECVRGLQGPASVQLTSIRQIFRIPLWYQVGEEEFQTYKDLIAEAGVEDAKVARVLQCSTTIDCACYFCTHVDERPRSPLSSLSGSAWSPDHGRIADSNGVPIIPGHRINSNGYHEEISAHWPFSGPSSISRRSSSNQTGRSPSTPRGRRANTIRPRRLFSPYQRPAARRPQDSFYPYPRPSANPASPQHSSPGAFRECNSPPQWTARPANRRNPLRCPCNIRDAEISWVDFLRQADPIQRTAAWVRDSQAFTSALHLTGAFHQRTSTPRPICYEW